MISSTAALNPPAPAKRDDNSILSAAMHIRSNVLTNRDNTHRTKIQNPLRAGSRCSMMTCVK
jgi:hypothetical protein